MSYLYKKYFQLDSKFLKKIEKAEEKIQPSINLIKEIVLDNQAKVLRAFKENRVSEFHFAGSTGYGYHDIGRQVLENIYAEAFNGEEALVRTHFVSGTHTLFVCLDALLSPAETLLSAAGAPYDTLQKVIGINTLPQKGTLAAKGVSYRQVDLTPEGRLDFQELERVLKKIKSVTVVLLQRSRGYAWRPSVSLAEIEKLSNLIKKINPNIIYFVDNCYGEFVNPVEPLEIGADLIAGSLIKNPGGGLAPAGGYAVGRKDLIELIADRLTAPGLGKEVGATLAHNRSLFQGLFLAPHAVGEALKTAIFAAALLEEYGFEVSPTFGEERGDIVQAVRFTQPDYLLSFCQGIQKHSPVDSYVQPQPANMAGYGDKVIMAAGTFIQGASLEMTADAPYRSPYTAYLQGGLTFEHGKIALIGAIKEVLETINRNKE
ncbi:methionine gamma-lyase family protein [Candidatus Contubernalis alkaliaceticus]|uniref:methionine gamma-lyase family protein n=1 Tax=Candidatus Contubernalis alkaliaceticus TaxID=338645 RepID=UPI001F4C3E6D|nr:methionine gamma-lyase family protein [Candidatus Contubernalis alkalaceticus]UNC91902.1 methionine gamma-lyase family protein [Candidatus Contubernalis alkalaceticus]